MKKLKRLIYLKLARRLNRNANGPVRSIISRSTKIRGDITSDSIVHIDGTVDGDVNCEELIIGIRGTVNGAINAKSMQLFGTLNGSAFVDTLLIAKTAKMTGDATHTSIAIEPGAYIDGRCIRKTDQQMPELKVITGRKAKVAN